MVCDGATVMFPWSQQTKGINNARSRDVTRITGAQQQRPESPTITPPGMQLLQST